MEKWGVLLLMVGTLLLAAGYYIKRPYKRAHWVAGHWKRKRHGWVWIPGHWRRG